MAKKQRKLVYNGHKGLPVGTRCIWCGEQTADPAYIINPGGNPLMACCCEDHFQKTNTFVRRDNKIRPVFYVRLGLVKTRRIIRIIMLCIAVLALASTLSVM